MPVMPGKILELETGRGNAPFKLAILCILIIAGSYEFISNMASVVLPFAGSTEKGNQITNSTSLPDSDALETAPPSESPFQADNAHDECAAFRRVYARHPNPPTATVIVTSNLIPTFPSTAMLEDTLDSLSMIRGLEPNTPIIITVDGLTEEHDSPNGRERLHGWVKRVRKLFKCHPYVQVVTSFLPLNIGKSIQQAMQLVTTEFVYLMEHDFPFVKEIDHQLLVTSMRALPDLRIVRFNQYVNRLQHGVTCEQTLTYAGMDYLLGRWSNNNHFTTREYYDWHFQVLGIETLKVPPEWVMMERQSQEGNCITFGMHLYGPVGDGPYLHHIDGKRTLNYNRTYTFNNDQRCPNSTQEVPSSVLPWIRCPP